ncbi:putative lipoprotein YbaY [Burkholderiales bacterium]|nr:putative lipoprotein YbaY [Burkholderiales bacterium]
MRTPFVAVVSTLSVLFLASCSTVEPAAERAPAAAPAAAAPASVIRGSILYREKEALPSDAELLVQLLDVSRPDQQVIVAETLIRTDGRQVPIAFTLAFDPQRATGRRHALNASIRYGGKVRYVTRARVSIDPAAPPQALAMMVAPGDAEPPITDSPAPPGPARAARPGAPPRRGAPPGAR